MYDRIKFFRRRQFVLGTDYIEYAGWEKVFIENDLLLSIHPDLTTTIVERQGNKAILLGYAIDPFQPDLTDRDIILRFVNSVSSVQDVFRLLEKLSGRFVLILKIGAKRWLFHDASALRQVQYCFDKDGKVWCASQAETLSERFNFQLDEEVLACQASPIFSGDFSGFRFENDFTPYREIKNLLPNHYLDLVSGRVTRFWPAAGCFKRLSVKEAIKRCAPILQNSISAAAKRFDLKMGISAGCDSRKSLAAANAVKDKITFFTHTVYRQSDVCDIEVPSRLLPKLGIRHHKIDIKAMDGDFRELYNKSATWAREKHGNVAFTALKHFGAEATVLNSNISEFTQVWYWLPKSKINAEGLAIVKSTNHPFIINEYKKWLDGARLASDESKMNILVLFDIESDSRWVPKVICEYDIAYETFNPYNNRYLLSLELSINERWRRYRRHDVPIKLIKSMWPQTLSEPINPEKNLLKRIKYLIWRSIEQKLFSPWLPIWEYARYIKNRHIFNNQGKMLKKIGNGIK